MLLTLRPLLDVLRALLPGIRRLVAVPSRVCHGGTGVAYRRMHPRRTRGTRGTSFMDVFIGMAITSVVLGFAVPAFPALMAPFRLASATRALASEFSVARMKAIAQNTRHRIVFDDALGTYQLQRETGANSWTAAAGMEELPSGVTFSEVPADPIFGANGMLIQDFEVEVQGAGKTQVVSVNILGNVEIEPAAEAQGGVVADGV